MDEERNRRGLQAPEPRPELLSGLAKISGPENVSADTLSRVIAARDCWPYAYLLLREGRMEWLPEAVVRPGSEQETAQVVKFCAERRVPVIPAGGGTGVCGGAAALQGGIVLDLKRMNRVLSLNRTNHTVEAEAGIIGEVLERKLNRAGFSLGHFPASMFCSSLGGWLAARSAGQLSSKYGKIEDMVVALSGVLPDGSRFHSSDAPRRAAGPDLDQLIIGCEGTLAVITKAVLAVHPLPEWSAYRGFLVPDFESGMEAARLIMREELAPAVARLYDEADTRLHAHSLSAGQVKGCLLIVGFEGPDHALTRKKAEKAFSLIKRFGRDLGEDPGLAWLKKRYSVSYLQSKVLSKPHTLLDTCEVAATWSNLPALYRAMKQAIEPSALCTAHMSHIYPEGAAIYFTFVAGSENIPPAETYQKIWASAMEACLQHGGTISHHHGIGALKARWMKEELGQALELFKRLKKHLDPAHIMNPGKMALEDLPEERR